MLLCFKQLWKKFRGEEKAPAHLGSSRDYNVDMMPKVINISYFPAYLASLLPI
jgi:RAB protein geranylgeranyltransferase component A